MKKEQDLPTKYLYKPDVVLEGQTVYEIPHPHIADYNFRCIVSTDKGWEHVSVSLFKNLFSGNRKLRRMATVKRCPTWEEMSYVKDLFWKDDEEVVQFHPPKSEYVNLHNYCLHLWKPLGVQYTPRF